jgi:hypothetical protein
MILIIILKIIITIFINNDINFLKLDLSLIYMEYIHVVFFMFILCRNLSKTRDALDSISLANIDLTFFFFGKLTCVLKEEDTTIIRGIPQIYNDNRNIKQQMATG